MHVCHLTYKTKEKSYHYTYALLFLRTRASTLKIDNGILVTLRYIASALIGYVHTHYKALALYS